MPSTWHLGMVWHTAPTCLEAVTWGWVTQEAAWLVQLFQVFSSAAVTKARGAGLGVWWCSLGS